MFRYVLASSVTALSLLIAAVPALGQSTNAPPILIETGKPLDPTTLPMTDDANKTAVTNYITAAKAAAPNNSVLATGANFASTTWSSSSTGQPQTLADTARVSLEICEFYAKAPCIIIGINGNDARDASGAWPAQPEMLVHTPGSRIDPWTIPFNSQFNRGFGSALLNAVPPLAVVVSTGGGWNSSSGKTILEAIDAAFATCLKNYPNNVCLLYSVNSVVVMAQ
jgi:hypothetical protein